MKIILVNLIIFYQKIISPTLHQLLGIKSACRSNPTCTTYARQAIERYGAWKGVLLSTRRLLNCQPYFTL